MLLNRQGSKDFLYAIAEFLNKYIRPHIFYFVNFANCFRKHKNKNVPMTFMPFHRFNTLENGDKNLSNQCDFSILMQTVVKNRNRYKRKWFALGVYFYAFATKKTLLVNRSVDLIFLPSLATGAPAPPFPQ